LSRIAPKRLNFGRLFLKQFCLPFEFTEGTLH
jgi:hypothetical protein